MIAIATRTGVPGPTSLWSSSSLRLPGGQPIVRRQPSAAVRRRRAVTALLAVAVLGLLLGVGSLSGAGQASGAPLASPSLGGSSPGAVAVHIVQPGDTLWAIARSLQPDGDVRPLVARLRAAAEPGPLVPGQRLRLDV